MSITKPLSGELLEVKQEIYSHAKNFGLDFYDVVFEVCDYDTVSVLASLGGFPSRYPHWRFGMDYDQLSKGNTYGFQKIYELVINTDPCYAYLLNTNRMVDQKLVMAHVYGHADFFKNNAWFRNTNRKMMDVMANNATKIRRYMDKYGQDMVESFIDKVLSLENLLDIKVLFETAEIHRKSLLSVEKQKNEEEKEDDDRSAALKSFMRSKKRNEKVENEIQEEELRAPELEMGECSKRDIMKFLMMNAPIEEWEADIIGILRDEAYYFLPQRLTKIMNEGWASYWHAKIMTEKVALASEIVDFADVHSGVMAMSRQQLNPYKIGFELFHDIEHRWNTGKFGKEYSECDDLTKLATWDKKTMLGREKIFEVRKIYNDITFIDEFFTQEFCERQKLFTYKFNQRTNRFEIDSRDFQEIKSKLLNQLTNFGQPIIEVESSNFQNKGELLLKHSHQGVDLDFKMASETMRNVFALWKRPINILTVVEGKEIIYHFDGKDLKSLK